MMNNMPIKILKEANEEEEDSKFDNQFEVMSELPKPKSSIKKNITSDYIYAKLGQAEREYMTENYRNAEFAKELLKRYGTTKCIAKWDTSKSDWIKNKDGSIKYFSVEDESKTEAERIKKNAERIFEFFMIQPHMIAILNRNRDDNFLVKLMGKYNEEEDKPAMYTEDDRSVLQKIKDKLGGSKEEVEYVD